MKVNYRMGQSTDAYQIAYLLHVASGGISSFLLDNILPNSDILDLIALGVTDKATNISFSNTLVAEMNKEIVGVLNFYPVHEHKIPDIMRAFVPHERLEYLAPLFSDLVPDSMYLHALAVKPEMPVGNSLFYRSIQYTRAMGIKKLSAHVWSDNTRFLKFLLKIGFEIYNQVNIPEHSLLPHHGGMVLLSYTIK